jgi:hypothetical protein
MKVISKVSNKRLIKGHEYEVESIYNDGTSNSWLEGKLSIGNLGRFRVDNFKMPDNKAVPKIKLEKVALKSKDVKETEIGDLLICKVDSYVLFNKDSLYKVKDIKEVEKFNRYKEVSVKFEGINRWIKLSNWNFRQLTDQEKRELSLNYLLNNENPDIVNKVERKIDLDKNKNESLMKEISKSILDRNRHHLSIIEWAIEKTGSRSKIKKEDFEDILNMKLGDILNQIG